MRSIISRIRQSIHSVARGAGSAAPAAATGIGLLLVFAIGRLLHLAVALPRLLAVEGFPWILVPPSIAIDWSLTAAICLPLLVIAVLPTNWRRHVLLRWFCRCYIMVILWMSSFLELAGAPFMLEFDARPNRIFFEYLVFPREIIATIAASFPLAGLLALGAFIGGAILSWRIAGRLTSLEPSPEAKAGRPAFVLLIAAFMLASPILSCWTRLLSWPRAIPDRLGAAVSSNGLASSLSALFTVVGGDLEVSRFYGPIDEQEAIARLRRSSLAPSFDDEQTLLRTVQPRHPSQRPRDLVIVVAEGLGARYVGSLGGSDLTPHIDEHARRGTLFTNFYGTGDRTLRGLESIILGIPSSPGRPVARLGEPPRGVWSLAAVLRDAGYRTCFVYAGDKYFDHMWPLLSAVGFDHVVDERDFSPDTPRGPWGVADGPLLERALHEVLPENDDQPRFTLILTTTLHDPFVLPADAPPAPEHDPTPLARAVRYMDRSLGAFLDEVEASPRAAETIVAVVADHDVRTQGPGKVPVEVFRLLALLRGPQIPENEIDVTCSQLDIASTIIPLLGIPLVDGSIGRDLLSLPPDAPGRAVMHTGHDGAVILGSDRFFFRPGLPPVVQDETDTTVPSTTRNEAVRDGLALLHAPSLMWR